MKILVTGYGFIGKHVVEILVDEGHDVSVLDRFPDRNTAIAKGVKVFLGDIRDRTLIKEAILQHEGVINLAGILGTMETVDDPYPSVETNIVGALNILEGCRPSRIMPGGVRGVQISVGNHFMHNSYAITKSAAEKFTLMYNKENGTKVSIIRALNAYGEYQKHRPVRKVIPNFIISALKGDPIQVYGNGMQVMDMIYVKDVAKILVRALLLDHGCYDKVLEAGTGRKTSINDIASIINTCIGNKAGIQYLPMRAGELENSVVLGNPGTLAPLGIGSTDLVSFEDGIERTISWYKEQYGWQAA